MYLRLPGTHYVDETDLKFVVFLLQPPSCGITSMHHHTQQSILNDSFTHASPCYCPARCMWMIFDPKNTSQLC
jgi:hypothetical protein